MEPGGALRPFAAPPIPPGSAQYGPMDGANLNHRIAQLNADVADLLGCTLVPASIRVADTIDGLHYTDRGTAVVAMRLELLDDRTACWVAP